MKLAKINTGSFERLILIFSGWGTDENIFRSLEKDGYDIIVVYDYRSEDFDMSSLDGYVEICVVAWSMGVFHAERFMLAHSALPITRRVAVNGTLKPVDDAVGIPVDIYEKTSLLPDRRSVERFYLRICGGKGGMQRLMPEMPQRDVDELREELVEVRERVDRVGMELMGHADDWDEILISENDLIFPPANMKRGWANVPDRVTEISSGRHIVDFRWLVDRYFVDKQLVGERFGAVHDTYNAEATVQAHVADRVASLLPRVSGGSVLEIGSGAGLLTRKYLPKLSNCCLTLWDLAPQGNGCLQSGVNIIEKRCDAEVELMRCDERYDLIVSSSTIQWFNSPQQSLERIARLLKPGGMAVISYYSKGTFSFLEGISGLRYRKIDTVDICRDYKVEEFGEVREVEFADAREALRHIRLTGVNSVRRAPMTVSETREVMRRLTDDDGHARLRFAVEYLIIKNKKQ